jgi:quercetin dioxygenase-like cupin family protein
MSKAFDPSKTPLALGPEQGRAYALGKMRAVFKADGAETRDAYSVSEWWLDPHTPGPGEHAHETEDDLFYVIEGTVTFTLDGKTIEGTPGTFVRAPAGIRHDFENRTDKRAGLLNFYTGPFEKDMLAIAEWYRNHPA